MIRGGEGFGRWLGHESKGLKNYISAGIKEAPEIPCFFYHMGTQQEGTGYGPGRWPSAKCNDVGKLILYF